MYWKGSIQSSEFLMLGQTHTHTHAHIELKLFIDKLNLVFSTTWSSKCSLSTFVPSLNYLNETRWSFIINCNQSNLTVPFKYQSATETGIPFLSLNSYTIKYQLFLFHSFLFIIASGTTLSNWIIHYNFPKAFLQEDEVWLNIIILNAQRLYQEVPAFKWYLIMNWPMPVGERWLLLNSNQFSQWRRVYTPEIPTQLEIVYEILNFQFYK